jgi:hypothetical protein
MTRNSSPTLPVQRRLRAAGAGTKAKRWKAQMICSTERAVGQLNRAICKVCRNQFDCRPATSGSRRERSFGWRPADMAGRRLLDDRVQRHHGDTVPDVVHHRERARPPTSRKAMHRRARRPCGDTDNRGAFLKERVRPSDARYRGASWLTRSRAAGTDISSSDARLATRAEPRV